MQYTEIDGKYASVFYTYTFKLCYYSRPAYLVLLVGIVKEQEHNTQVRYVKIFQKLSNLNDHV